MSSLIGKIENNLLKYFIKI